jgi:hypothetical protein
LSYHIEWQELYDSNIAHLTSDMLNMDNVFLHAKDHRNLYTRLPPAK